MTDKTSAQSVDLKELGGKVASGAMMIAAARFLIRGIGLINTLVVARLLAPDDFGVVAIGVTITQLLQNFSDIGVAQAIIRQKILTRRVVNTFFTLSIIRGVLISSLLVILSFFANDFFHDERTGGIFLAMALAAFLQAVCNPRFHHFERKLDFRKSLFVEVADKAVAVIVSLSLAIAFRNYWAIVGGVLAGASVRLVMSYAMIPYMPRLSLKAYSDVISFTGWMTGVSFVAALNNKLDALIIGRFLGAGPTGVYTMGTQLAWLAADELASPISRALYPGFSALQGDRMLMRKTFLRGVETLAAVVLPASLGIAFVADDLIMTLLGEQWMATSFVVAAYAPVTALIAIYALVQWYATALGQARFIFIREFLFLCVRLPIFCFAVFKFGLEGAIWAICGLGVLHAAFNAALFTVLERSNPLLPLWQARRTVVALGGLALYFLAVKPLISINEDMPSIVTLCGDIAMGATFYGAALFGVWRLSGKPPGVDALLFGAFSRFAHRLISRPGIAS